MSCSCLSRLLNALKPPWFPLPALNIPPVALRLGVAAGKLAGLSATASASASAAASAAASASIGLPPLNASMVASVAATARAVAQLKGLGINLLDPTGPSRLEATLGLMLSLPAVDLPPLSSVGPLLGVLGALGSAQASLGVNLLAPGASVSATAAINAAVTASAKLAPPALPPLAASYSALANAAESMGCSTPAALHSGLSVLAKITLPPMAAPGLLAQLLALLSAHSMCQGALGFSPFSATAGAQISAALAPLSLLESASLTKALSAAEALGSPAPAALSANANFSAFAGFSCDLKLPDFGAAIGLSAVMGQARTGPCSSGCPVAL